MKRCPAQVNGIILKEFFVMFSSKKDIPLCIAKLSEKYERGQDYEEPLTLH